jgi:two-component system sensor histidine kinase YesM
MKPFRRGGRRSYFLRVFVLFMLASLVPIALISTALTGLAQGALARAMDERGRSAAWAFAERVRALERSLDLSLAVISGASETQTALGSPSPPRAEAVSAVQRLLAREAARSPNLAFSLADAAGDRTWTTRELPPDARLPAYANWGIVRKANLAAGESAFSARRRIAADGGVVLVVAARLVRDAGGRLLGVAVAEIYREALVVAAGEGRELLGADAELVDGQGLVAFSLADPGREGLAENEAPFAPKAVRGPYRASTQVFSASLALPEPLLADLGKAMRAATNAGLGVAALLAALFALAASRLVTGPVLALSASMKKVRTGDLGVRVARRSNDELGELVDSFNAMTAEIGELVAAAVERRELLRKAELGALAARMDPHFLRNALNSIKSLAKLGRVAEVAEVATRLGKLLGSEARGRNELSTVGEGLEFARHYLYVERARFGERLAVVEEVDPALLPHPLPVLVIEPLVENALIHGLEAVTGAWTMRIEGRIEEGAGGARRGIVAIEDDGPGMEADRLAELGRSLGAGEITEGEEHLGLSATNRRLRLHFGPEYGLIVTMPHNLSKRAAEEGRRGFRVELGFPVPALALAVEDRTEGLARASVKGA